MTSISNKIFIAAAICGTIFVGAPNATFAATPTLATASDAQASVIQLSAWPRIRDSLLGMSRDYHRHTPPPPPPPIYDRWHNRGRIHRVTPRPPHPVPPPRPRFQPAPHPQPGPRPHVRHASFMLDGNMGDGVVVEQPPMV